MVVLDHKPRASDDVWVCARCDGTIPDLTVGVRHCETCAYCVCPACQSCGGLRTDVCVKTITAATDPSERGTAFFREMALIHELGPELAASLRNVCVYAEHMVLPPATGSADTMWLVFPLMAHGSLDTACEEDRLSVSTRLRVFADVSDALAKLHQLDMLHRDVALRNVLLDAQDRARLCDLGLACRGAHAWRCDRFPIYDWAPELVVGADDEPYTSASETWSFGVVMLDAMLSGNPFWSWHNPALADPEQDLYAAFRAMLAAPAQEWPVLTADGKLPFEFDQAAVAASGTSAGRRGRLQTGSVGRPRSAASDKFVDIAIYNPSSAGSGSAAVSDAPAMDLARVEQWWRDCMWLPMDSAGTNTRALNLLIHACCRWQSNQRPRMAFVAKLLACLAAEEPPVLPVILVTSVTEVLLLAQWHLLGLTVAHRWRRDVNATFVLSDASQGAALQAVLPQLRQAVQLAEGAERGANPVQWASRLSHLAVVSEAARDVASAIQCYQRVLEADEASLGPLHPDVAESLTNLADLLKKQGEYASARPLYERVLAINEASFDPQLSAASLNNLAELLQAQGDYASARPLYERALAIWEALLGPRHSQVAISLNNLAALFHSQHDYASARPLFERALAISESSLGPQHPDVAMGLSNLASCLNMQGEHELARSLLVRALAINEASLDPQHPEVAFARLKLWNTSMLLALMQ
jgi:tetratricopeptide (TPR) repeat protein/serine/threonine protein kinase